MSMKFFTLSSVCVMVFCMLLAVSGTTDLSRHEKVFYGQMDSGTSSFAPGRTEDARVIHVSPSSSEPSVGLAAEMEGAQKEHKDPHQVDFNRQVRIFGLLLVLAWVFISVKLLSSE